MGGNLADPAARIPEAIQLIADLPGTTVLRRSRLYRSAPWGDPGQPDFVNAACLLETSLGPEALLETPSDSPRSMMFFRPLRDATKPELMESRFKGMLFEP